jgi:hypothetical protein
LNAVCSKCGKKYSPDEYSESHFCRECGSLLQLCTVSLVKPVEGATRDENFIYDVELASSIGDILHTQFREKTGYFEGYIMPEYIMPDISEGSQKLALYYTYVIAVDYQTDAHKLWRNARQLYRQHPDYFEPETILKTPDEALRRFIRGLGARYPNNGCMAWKTISRILLKRYEGDPRNITSEPLTSREIWKRLDKFPYLRGKKIGTLYLRVMGDLGLFKVSDLDRLDVAVDVQVSRFTFYTGALKPLGPLEGCVHNPPIKPAIERVWRKAASRVNCAPWQLDMPIWVIASNQCTNQICGPCPVKGLCERNFDARIQGNNLRYSP